MRKPNFSEDVIVAVISMQNGYCDIDGCYESICDTHHKLSNSIINRERFPLFTNSIMNCVGLCREHHDSAEIYKYKISLKKAECYERYLNGDLK